MQQGRSARNVEILLRVADRHLSETVAAAHVNCAALSPSQIWAFYGVAGAVFWNYEDSFLQFQADALDAGSWESDVATIRRLLRSPAYRVAWRMAREGMSGGYRDYVDTVLAEVKPDASHTLIELWAKYASEELALIIPTAD
jgi:hypothetical protein